MPIRTTTRNHDRVTSAWGEVLERPERAIRVSGQDLPKPGGPTLDRFREAKRCYAGWDMRLLSFLLALTLAQAAPTPTAPPAREIAPDTFLLPGAMLPNRGPDGNTVVLVAPSGLHRDRYGTPFVAQRRHPRVRARTTPAGGGDPQYALAPRPLERQPSGEGRVPAGENLHDPRRRSGARLRRVPRTQRRRGAVAARPERIGRETRRNGDFPRHDGCVRRAAAGRAGGTVGRDDDCRTAARRCVSPRMR